MFDTGGSGSKKVAPSGGNALSVIGNFVKKVVTKVVNAVVNTVKTIVPALTNYVKNHPETPKDKSKDRLKKTVKNLDKNTKEGKAANEALDKMNLYFDGYATVPQNSEADLHNKLISPLNNQADLDKLVSNAIATPLEFIPLPDFIDTSKTALESAATLAGSVGDYLTHETYDPDSIVNTGTYDVYKFRGTDDYDYTGTSGIAWGTPPVHTSVQKDYTILIGTGGSAEGATYIWTTKLTTVGGTVIPVDVDYMSVGVTHGTATIEPYK